MAAAKLNPLSQTDYAVVLWLMDASTQLARGRRAKALSSIDHARRILAADLEVHRAARAKETPPLADWTGR